MKQNTKKENSRLGHLKSEYDIIIIGGGITGANVLWDATLRGYNCLLVEKNDYASGTSQATSKLIHGGLRYLKNLEFGLVRESLSERRYLAKISPHAVRPMGFIIPIRSIFQRVLLFFGMELYNALSFDRNQEIDADVQLPRYRWNSLGETIYKVLGLNRKSLKGSFQYYDYANPNPEKHTTEFILSAKEKGAHAFNYLAVTTLRKQNSGGYTVGLTDTLSGKKVLVYSKVVVNSAGPWADVIESMTGVTAEKKLVRSKGIHAVVRNICGNECAVLSKRDGSHLFVIPWRGKTIIGTTDTAYEDDPDAFKVKQSELVELLDEVNYSFGFAKLTLKDVDYYYGGLRPLVEDPGSTEGTYSASRKSEIFHYENEGFPGFFSALGGKYTTSRAVAENLVNAIDTYTKGEGSPCATKFTPLLGGRYQSLKELINELQFKFPKIEGAKLETLAKRYGSVTWKILSLVGKETYRIPNGEIYFEEEVEYMVTHEDIFHLTDFYFRRSGVGTVGILDPMEKTRLNKKIAKILGWNAARLKEEEKLVDERYKWFVD
ncbi:glycerol-3-phosphate dehydrogenase/oxidase [Leptospira meyeri]|uniref:glycerol-3-phosphate dehydrogenase/oxidase n=1 Tax=Leptospira meyeri TaxID=29508 RepID=UPI000C2AE630|nr:glycerol-3-phosphate dehydrogenase/oxidase [Leptospira meyeri]MCW7490782.1 glycerol-3-phosphate dehydrogenase/oxidase [Leptospira meyeri]PJZ80528.1 glycerol-3-phosphate dehydrogenase [Leptospira meyeri]PJZ95734.1 glycerol-3-phosphate dehydrogenase [Leptospira meyeri]TGM21683.1 glycerol-3-phosphate dehydrogenase/oxidase [Leptospira meyeri]TGM61143.1 glycerol-3-phosphate dehydrogenase/oxidase [Leptospira meyeri]